ncbi:uncharacterized protein LOC121919691 [Sceloporus undulatus]|uniref:uncharacterized protein LOC121919691 n=1 Tax=Sceloporus undulatus TaxID=8520 RepID=UPI001C4C64D6|nr:uncharacterized protein LOC121919691 [Sceloporus undulatus]
MGVQPGELPQGPVLRNRHVVATRLHVEEEVREVLSAGQVLFIVGCRVGGRPMLRGARRRGVIRPVDEIHGRRRQRMRSPALPPAFTLQVSVTPENLLLGLGGAVEIVLNMVDLETPINSKDIKETFDNETTPPSSTKFHQKWGAKLETKTYFFEPEKSFPFIEAVQNGYMTRITDNDIKSLVLDVEGTNSSFQGINVSITYIVCPNDPKITLGITLSILVLLVKNIKKQFTFEVQVLDSNNVRRQFHASTYQSTTRVTPFFCTMRLCLDDGWSRIQFNLSDFTQQIYKTNYVETLRVQIHANCCIRKIYFSDKLYSEDELPPDLKIDIPVKNKGKK